MEKGQKGLYRASIVPSGHFAIDHSSKSGGKFPNNLFWLCFWIGGRGNQRQ